MFFGPKGAFRRPNAGFWRLQAPETSIYNISGSKTRGNPENRMKIMNKSGNVSKKTYKKK